MPNSQRSTSDPDTMSSTASIVWALRAQAHATLGSDGKRRYTVAEIAE
jgi:hypothetical protein